MVTIYYLYVEPCHHIYGRKRTVKIKSELRTELKNIRFCGFYIEKSH